MIFKVFINSLKYIFNTVFDLTFKKPYWVKITTKQPQCTYYFGPFEDRQEAQKMQHGYIEDLMSEKALGITVQIKRCTPTKLTIVREEELV